MKNIFEAVISRGSYDLAGLLANIDKYHIEGKLSDADRDALYAEARDKATASESINVLDKLAELEERVRALEEAGSTTGTTGDTSAAPEYQVGKWYHAGDRVTHEGKVYTCTAPSGVVCVWSPTEYPAYWQEVTA